MESAISQLEKRNADIKLADSHKSGWALVKAIKDGGLDKAEGSAKQRVIRRAERIAEEAIAARKKERKPQQKSRSSYSRHPRYGYSQDDSRSRSDDSYKSVGNSRNLGASQRSTYIPDKRNYSGCHECGSNQHFVRDCPRRRNFNLYI